MSEPIDPPLPGVAVVGMAGRFPGAPTVADFWRNLRDGVESISRFTPEELAALGIDPARPSVVFVGRNTRQKGVPYLLRAAAKLPADVQLVLCLGAVWLGFAAASATHDRSGSFAAHTRLPVNFAAERCRSGRTGLTRNQVCE